MNRITAVTKLHFVNLWTIIWVPAIILGAILVLNIAIWWIVLSAIDTAEGRANAQEGFGYSGSTFYIFVHMMVVAVQAFNLTFPFALGYGSPGVTFTSAPPSRLFFSRWDGVAW
jgi:hypothetical protein